MLCFLKIAFFEEFSTGVDTIFRAGFFYPVFAWDPFVGESIRGEGLSWQRSNAEYEWESGVTASHFPDGMTGNLESGRILKKNNTINRAACGFRLPGISN